MKKALTCIALLMGLFSQAQTYTSVFGRWQYQWLKVDSGYRGPQDTLKSALIGSTAVKGSTLYIKLSTGIWAAITGAGGSGVWGSIAGTLSSQADLMAKFGTKYDTTVRKLDTLYAVTDSTFGYYVNGQFRTFKARGSLLSFNGRNGAIILTFPDVVTALGYTPSDLPNVVNSLQVVNNGNTNSWQTGVFSARPAPGNFGSYYTATDSLAIYFDNGISWLSISKSAVSVPSVFGRTGAVTAQTGDYTPAQVGLANVLNSLQIVNTLGTPSASSDIFANRPAAGTAGRLFVSTDTKEIYRDNGSSWDKVGSGASGGVTTYAALTDVNLTSLINGQVAQYNSGSGKWVNITPTNALVGLANVPNVDATNAANISSGTLPPARIGATSIDLTTKVTGLLPDANIASAAVWNAKVSDSGFALQRAALTNVPLAKVISGASVFIQWDSIATNPGAIVTQASRQKLSDSLQLLINALVALKKNIADSGSGPGSNYVTQASRQKLSDSLQILITAGLALKKNLADSAFGAGYVTQFSRQKAVDSILTVMNAALALKANIASPTFTGIPAAPTASPGTNTTQLATTAFVTNAVASSGADSGFALLYGQNSTAPIVKIIVGGHRYIIVDTNRLGGNPFAMVTQSGLQKVVDSIYGTLVNTVINRNDDPAADTLLTWDAFGNTQARQVQDTSAGGSLTISKTGSSAGVIKYDIALLPTSNNAIDIGSTSSQYYRTVFASNFVSPNTAAIGSTGANPDQFKINGTEKARVSPGGNFLVGSTTDNNAFLQAAVNTTTNASLYLPPSAGVAVTSPINGHFWNDGTHLFFQSGGTSHDLLAGGFSNPMTTNGDIITQAAGVPARLGIGTNGFFPMSNGSSLSYVGLTVGTFSGSSQPNGLNISGNLFTFGPADATNPGMVSTGTQTWAGNKNVVTQAVKDSTTKIANTLYVDRAVAAGGGGVQALSPGHIFVGNASSVATDTVLIKDLSTLPEINSWVFAQGDTASSFVTNYKWNTLDSLMWPFSTTTGGLGAENGGWITASTSGDSVQTYTPIGVLFGASILAGHRQDSSGIEQNNLFKHDTLGSIGWRLSTYTHYTFVNHSWGGQSDSTMRPRFMRDVIGGTWPVNDARPSKTLTHRPFIAIIGGDMALNGMYTGESLAKIESNYLWMAQTLMQYGIPAVFTNCVGQGGPSATLAQNYPITQFNAWLASGILKQYNVAIFDLNSIWNSGILGGFSSFQNNNWNGSSLVNTTDFVHFTAAGYDTVAKYLFLSCKIPVLTKMAVITAVNGTNGIANYNRPTSIHISGSYTGTIYNGPNTVSLPNAAFDTVSVNFQIPDTAWTTVLASTNVVGTSTQTGISTMEYFLTNNPTGQVWVTQSPITKGASVTDINGSSLTLINNQFANGQVLIHTMNSDYSEGLRLTSNATGSTTMVLNGLTNTAAISSGILSVYNANPAGTGIATNSGIVATGTVNQVAQFQIGNSAASATGFGFFNSGSGTIFNTGSSATMTNSMFTFQPYTSLKFATSNTGVNYPVFKSNYTYGNTTGYTDTLGGWEMDQTEVDTTTNRLPGVYPGIAIVHTPTNLGNNELLAFRNNYGFNFLNYDGGATAIGDSSVSQMHGSAALEVNSTVRTFLPPRMTLTQRNAIGYLKSVTVSGTMSGYSTYPKINVTVSSGTAPRIFCNISGGAITACTLLDKGTGLGGVTPTISPANTSGSGAVLTPVMSGPDSGSIIYLIDSNYVEYYNGYAWIPMGQGSSGTYTPTITTVTNCSSPSSGLGHWIRMGNQVTVDVPVTVIVTTGGSATEFYVSLPISSAISSGTDVTGQGQLQGAYTIGPGITGNTTNHVADVTYTQTASSSGPNMFLHFTYTVD